MQYEIIIKSLEQQCQLSVHRVRQGFVEQRTAIINRMRGLLSEFGIVLPLKASTVRRQAAACLEDLPGWSNTVVGDLLSELARVDERIALYDGYVAQMAREGPRARQLMRLRGVGETTATAILAMFGNGHDFKCGRQFAAWLGLVPSQYSSGGKARLGHITKAGDRYMRMLLGCGAGRPVGPDSAEQNRRDQPLGHCSGRAPRLLASDCGYRCQECANGMGCSGAGRAIHYAGMIASTGPCASEPNPSNA